MFRGWAGKVGRAAAAAALAFWTAPVARGANEATAEAMKKVAELTKGVRAYSAKMEVKRTRGERTMTANGTIVAKAPAMIATTLKTESERGTTEQKAIQDGKTLWTVRIRGDNTFVSKVDIVAVGKALGLKDGEENSLFLDGEPVSLTDPLASLDRKTITFKGMEKVGDADMFVFEGDAMYALFGGRRRGGEPETPAPKPRMKLYLSAKDGLLRVSKTMNAEGAVVSETTCTDVKLGPPVEDSAFAFTPPEGTEVRDQTERQINALKAMIPEKPKTPEATPRV